MTALWVVLAVLALNGAIVFAGYRHQSARSDRRRNTTRGSR